MNVLLLVLVAGLAVILRHMFTYGRRGRRWGGLDQRRAAHPRPEPSERHA